MVRDLPFTVTVLPTFGPAKIPNAVPFVAVAFRVVTEESFPRVTVPMPVSPRLQSPEPW